jgi:potassium/hydrogen antiporter
MVDVAIAFLTVSLIIIVGYFGMLFFKKTKISELIILMIIGLIIGPISTAMGVGIIGPSELSVFNSFLPFFAAFALIMILFEGGMQLNFFKALKALTNALGFTIAVFILGILFTMGALWFLSLSGLIIFDPLLSLFIGAVIGGTSSAVIIPIINSTSAREETKTLLSLESALTDALCIVTAVAIGQIFLVGSADLGLVSSSIMANFAIAAVIGFASGLVWLKALTYLDGKAYSYLMTLAALLLIYSLVQLVGGNGAIAILIFGIVLGNSIDITKMLQLEERTIDSSIKTFHSELSFLVKTFFFVYLGILFRLEFATPPIILISVVLIVLILASRFIVANGLAKLKPIFKSDTKLISMMGARGLAAAVLVSLPISMGLDKAAPNLFTPEIIGTITAVAFLVILGSNILTTIGVFITENAAPKIKAKNEEDRMTTEIKEIAKPKTNKKKK